MLSNDELGKNIYGKDIAMVRYREGSDKNAIECLNMSLEINIDAK